MLVDVDAITDSEDPESVDSDNTVSLSVDEFEEEYSEDLTLLRNSTPQQTNKSKVESDVLYFVLQELKNGEKLDFDKLEGKEKLWSKVLKSFAFLEVHLAVVTEIATQSPGQEAERHFEVGQWTDSSNHSIDLALNIDFVDQLVIGARKLLVSPISRTPRSYQKTLTRRYNFAVLVIWPKKKTEFIYSKYKFDSALVMERVEREIEAQLSTERPGILAQLAKRTDLLEELALACDSYKTFIAGTFENDDRSYRLLKMCLHLRARDKGLDILNAVSDRQLNKEVFKGSFLKVLAAFIAKVAGIYSIKHWFTFSN